MSTLTFIESTDTLTTAHARIGFELGWDYAHYRVTPPAPYAQQPSALYDGLLAGRAAFGLRTLLATRSVRKWLQLRLHAWLRGRSVELVQVTPNYLAQIDVSHCPITRIELSAATLDALSQEPLPAGHPFWGDPRILITPHIATRTDRLVIAQQTLANLASLQQGQRPLHQVDLERGY